MKQAFKTSYKSREIIQQIIIVGLTMIGAFVILIPVMWMIIAAIRPIKEVLSYPPRLFSGTVTFTYFKTLFENELYRNYFLNTCILSFFIMLLTLILGLLAAYGFSRYKIKGGRGILLGILSLLMLPPITMIIPYFRLAKATGLYDTLLGLIIFDTAFILPIMIWLLKGYVDSIPVELEEAAIIDGCTRIKAIWKVLVPLMIPSILGTATYALTNAWNEYLMAVILTETPSVQPLTVGLASFFGQNYRDWNSIMALSTISSLPLLLIFIFFQRWVIQGMSSGGLK